MPTASAVRTFSSAWSFARSRVAPGEGGERHEADQAPERLAPDAAQDVEPATLGGHLGDHAVVPQAPAEDRGEDRRLDDAGHRRTHDRLLGAALKKTSAATGSAYGHFRNTAVDASAPAASAVFGFDASSAAPSSTGGASSSGVSAPCSRTAHG